MKKIKVTATLELTMNVADDFNNASLNSVLDNLEYSIKLTEQKNTEFIDANLYDFEIVK